MMGSSRHAFHWATTSANGVASNTSQPWRHASRPPACTSRTGSRPSRPARTICPGCSSTPSPEASRPHTLTSPRSTCTRITPARALTVNAVPTTRTVPHGVRATKGREDSVRTSR
ncbi:hypothetical protein D3C85_1276160 [compost metagenome]